ncbi:MAG: OmpH family outer membrane protein [Pseudomonadota bacterium]
MNFRVLFGLLSIFCAFNSFAAESGYQARIAIVDVQAILEKSLAVQSIRKTIEGVSEALHKEMLSREQELKQAEEVIIKKRGVIKEEEFDKEVTNFGKKVSDAQRIIQEKKAKLEQAHAEAMAKVHEATIGIIRGMSKEYGFNVALPNSNVLYATDDLNITAEVIAKLNSQLKSITVNYK